MKNTSVKYDSKYDIVKFILSLFVVAIHSLLFPLVLYPWLRVAVPLFFLISSYFFFSSLQKAPLENHRKILKKFALRNLKLYGCWFVILLPITLYVRQTKYFSNGLLGGLQNFFKGLFFGSTFVASWFIVATVLGVLIVYGLSKLVKRNWVLLLFSIFTFCFVTLESSYLWCVKDTALETVFHVVKEFFGGSVCSFPAAILWVFLGKCFAEKKRKIFPLWVLIAFLILSCIGLYCEWKYVLNSGGSYNNDSYFMLLPVCCTLFAIIQRIPPIHWSPSIHLKHASTVIYVAHGSLIPVWGILLKRTIGFSTALIIFAVTLVSCLVLTVFIEFVNKKCSEKKVGKLLRSLY